MRYRPIGSSGSAVSTLCLSLGARQLAKGPQALKSLIFSALEAGVNAYHLELASPVLMQTVGEALSHVERQLLWVSLTLGTGTGQPVERNFSSEALTKTVEESLHNSGLGWFDVAVLHDPAENELPLSALQQLKALRSSGQVRFLGIRGHDRVTDTYLSTGAFDILFTPYSVDMDGPSRTRIRTAQRLDIPVFAYDFDRDVRLTAPKGKDPTPKKKSLFSFGARPEVQVQGKDSPFGFLHHTPGWTGESLSLALVLTEPSIASVLVHINDPERIEALASVTERSLPAGLSAQIEMARVS